MSVGARTVTVEPVTAFRQTTDSGLEIAPYFSWYVPLNRLAAAVLLVPGLPLIACLVALVRLTSRGPGIFAQQRVGRDGRLFTMYKIRTMRCDAEVGTGAVWSQPGDSRVTFLGRIFRALHLDELPQLWNVLRGEMALMGPRPERPEFTRLLAEEISDYYDRLAVLPGITGLAQINLPPDSDLDSVRRKLILDKEYIATATMGMDIRIALRTLLRLLSVHGDWPSHALGLYREVRLPHEVRPEHAAPDLVSLVAGNVSAAPLGSTNGSSRHHKATTTRAAVPATSGPALTAGEQRRGFLK